MSVWAYLILAIVCITSHDSTPEDGSCEKVQPTISYTFVGRSQFSSISYRTHCGAVQTTTEQHKKTITKTEDCQLYAGASYRGTVAVTKTGRTCQRWGSQTPHEHYNSLAFLPLAGLEQNYCRNPDGEPGVWCYTTDPGKRWEYCDVPACVTKELETIERSGTYYRLVTKAMTYDDANETCAADGGHLADVKTRELQDFLITKIQEVGADGCYWIGLHKITGNWTWSDGTPLSSCDFSDWAPGEPKGDQYVQLAITSHWLYLAGKWDDTGRQNHHYSICQTGTFNILRLPKLALSKLNHVLT
ncbi:uncharacterized protein LOC144877322 [Branchiostoma floridae x Branchiostoma japonicum]